MFKKSTVLALHFAPSLRFTLSLQSAVCILHSVCVLPLVRSLQSTQSVVFILHWLNLNLSREVGAQHLTDVL